MRIWIILLKFKTISVWSQHNFWDFKFVFDSINTQRVNYNNIAICLLFSSCNHDGLLAQQYTQTFNSHHPVYPWVATMCHTMTQPQQPPPCPPYTKTNEPLLWNVYCEKCCHGTGSLLRLLLRCNRKCFPGPSSSLLQRNKINSK